MVKDARTFLNMKRKQKVNSRNSGFVRYNQISDARQILKQKKQGIQKSNLSRFSIRSSFSRNRGLFHNQFKPAFSQQGTKQTIISRNPNKTVKVARGGILKVTSRIQNQPREVSKLGKTRYVSDSSGLTVTTKNRRFLLDDEPVDNGDELESMTLQDLPEINTMRDVPHSLLSQKKNSWQASSSSQSTLLSRLAKTMENTMVADSIGGLGDLSQPSWSMIVTNLQASVTEEDIIELFSHVGSMKNAQIIQPGVALVEYYSKDDVEKAYEIYHNRLLDDYPMQCVIQNEPSSSRTSIASRLGGKFSPASTSSRQTASVFRPTSRRVAFTVKLP